MGFSLALTKDGQIVRPEEFAAWPEEKRRNVQAVIEDLEKQFERIARQIPQREKEHRDGIRRLNRKPRKFAIGHSVAEARTRFADLPKVLEHLERVRAALIDNVGMFVAKSEDEDGAERPGLSGAFEPYEVNVLVTRETEDHGVPIIEELHPTLGNLIGRIEYVSQQGVLVTNFRLIKAGALHRANGRYLLLDVRNLLSEPFSWAALKRV
jgi:predicted ATP-dependent protease